MGYDNLVISIKSSDVMMCVNMSLFQIRLLIRSMWVSQRRGTHKRQYKVCYRTWTDTKLGIGDTIRVSLTGSPLEEIKSAKLILRTLGLRKGGIEVVSCPTCYCTQIDLIGLANQETMVSG